MASNKTNLRPIYRSANKLKHDIEYYVNEKVAKKLYESITTNIMTTFSPETKHGKEVKAFNEEQKKYAGKYRKKLPYNNRGMSGTLLQAIHVDTINGEVQLVVDKIPYEDETGKRNTERTALNVYKYLNYGTSGSKQPYPFKVITGATTLNGKTRYAFSTSPKIEGRHFHEKTQQEVATYANDLRQQVLNHTFRIRNRKEK